MSAQAAIAQAAGSLVRRARAGDEVAAAILFKTGERARKGDPRAKAAFATAQAYIAQHPAEKFTLVREPAIIMHTHGASTNEAAAIVPVRRDPSASRPPLPPGIFGDLHDPTMATPTIVRAAEHQKGLDAAAAVLAAGPLLTGEAIAKWCKRDFGTDPSHARAFMHGVQFSGEDEWKAVAPRLALPARKCLAVGQCVGRARALQAVRLGEGRISDHRPVAGWELGE
jgi:hypothetical protein